MMPVLSRRNFVASSSLGLLAARLPHSAKLRAIVQQWHDDPSLERRKQYLVLLQRLLDPTEGRDEDRLNAKGDQSWEDWIKRTGELPPDFEVMPSQPFLSDPLLMLDASHPTYIRTPQQW